MGLRSWRWVVVVGAGVGMSGCFGLLVGDPHHPAYVPKRGDADKVGESALKHHDSVVIQQKLETLRGFVARGDTVEAAAAGEWYKRIVEGVEADPSKYGLKTAESRRDFADGVFGRLAVYCGQDAVEDQLFAQVKPGAEYGEWREAWEEAEKDRERLSGGRGS